MRLLTVLLRKDLLKFLEPHIGHTEGHGRAWTYDTPVNVTPVKQLLSPYATQTLHFVEFGIQKWTYPLVADILGPGSPATPTSVTSHW